MHIIHLTTMQLPIETHLYVLLYMGCGGDENSNVGTELVRIGERINETLYYYVTCVAVDECIIIMYVKLPLTTYKT